MATSRSVLCNFFQSMLQVFRHKDDVLFVYIFKPGFHFTRVSFYQNLGFCNCVQIIPLATARTKWQSVDSLTLFYQRSWAYSIWEVGNSKIVAESSVIVGFSTITSLFSMTVITLSPDWNKISSCSHVRCLGSFALKF